MEANPTLSMMMVYSNISLQRIEVALIQMDVVKQIVPKQTLLMETLTVHSLELMVYFLVLPLIVYRHQTISVEVVNMMLTEVTTIHWHGLAQLNTYWMDGAGTVSQCPIEPGTSFTYVFNFITAGTFWYHSHSGAQRSEGLFGALIVRDEDETRNYPNQFNDIPEEHTLTLLDWQREESTTLFWKDLAKIRPTTPVEQCPDNVPTTPQKFELTRGVDKSGIGTFSWWSGVINGLGKHEDVAFKNSILSVFTVERGQTYRFRLIGVQSVFAFRFSIDNHKLIVIATDTWLIEPVETDFHHHS